MFDYTEISLYMGKDTLNTARLTPTYEKQNWKWYILDVGVQPLKVGFSQSLRELRIKGSLPYFAQGHNASHSPEALRESWQYIEEILNVRLFAAYVNTFEYGVIVQTPCKPSLILEHHARIPGLETRSYLNESGHLTGKDFLSSTLKAKLYDPIANYKAKRLSKAAYTQFLGLLPDTHYLRMENHYKKPERYFKEQILLTDFFNPTFQQQCKTELMDTYNRIIKTKPVALPDDKGKLSTANIVLAFAQKIASEQGIDAEQQIRNLISNVPADVLSKDDRKARKRQLKKMLEEISSAVPGSHDLSDLLSQKLHESEKIIKVL